jgi:hypothetical protein
MVEKPIFDAGFTRLTKPDEIRCDAVADRLNQRNDVPPDVRRGRVAVQKEHGG